ncbi:transcription factor [Sporothrix brasiliensis 5110]|uniref:Transcription factor n=1 Tax=Sporothrix brasiliensis 5110 TaxID=1398154 RepID=A0A0C2J4G9_9PEZI|nr:transcription factor [Sporothrix brasiliensis 5110]KIH93920.1 transcription factor [Sporothrix brasiliensis 5110]
MDGSLRVLDIQEKEVGAAKPPSFPTPRSTGFPEPKKRARFASAFKQQRQAAEAAVAAGISADPPKATFGPAPPSFSASPWSSSRPPAPTQSKDVKDVGTFDEKAGIDRENREMLASMAPDEIAEARNELLSNLDPGLLQILLRRANLDDGSNAGLPGEVPSQPEQAAAPPPPEIRIEESSASTAEEPKQSTNPKKKVLFASVEDAEEKDDTPAARKTGDEALFTNDENVPAASDLAPISSAEKAHDHDHDHDHSGPGAIHFPHAPAMPDLDPNDPDFLETLHAKYFPNLPADPARLAWMAPLPTADSPADRESPYYPGQESVAVSQLRFDFRGRLIPPKLSRKIPVSKGLHHHGVAPEAAGYTIGELARLARSAVPSQRCVAFQLLGRLLYRLGKGEFGGGGGESGQEGTGSAVDEMTSDPRVQLAQGIWRSLSEGRVLETLREAASVEEGQGHRGSRAYAIEAIWLYEKGGWKERWQGR